MRFNENQRQTLLSPLTEDNFCGSYLKSDRQVFRPLRNEFNLAQTSLRKLTQNPDPSEIEALIEENQNNWGSLSDSLFTVFQQSSRDIELAGWMLVSQVIIDPSLNCANQVSEWLKELVSSHWDNLQPILPDNKIKAGDDAGKKVEIDTFKVKAFVQLVGESEDSSLLYSPLLMTPLIGDLDYFRYQSEERKGNLTDLRHQYNSVALENRAHLTELVQNLSSLAENMTAIETQVKVVCQKSLIAQPGFAFVTGLLAKMLKAIEFISGIKPAVASSQAAAAVPENKPEADANLNAPVDVVESTVSMNQIENSNMAQPTQQAATTVSFASIAEQQEFNRDQAFHQLRELSEFFKKTEPHSPVPYLLEKAIRWGYMPLPELMTELLSNQQETIARVFNLTGLDEEGQVGLPDLPARNYPVSSHSIPSQNVTSAPAEVVAKEPLQNNNLTETKSTPSTSNEAESVNNQTKPQTEQKSDSSSSLSW